MSRWISVLLLSFVLLCAVVVPAGAQTTATIVGTVTDASGGVLAGATITVTNVQTGLTRRVSANEHGVYVAPSLPVGQYSVAAEMPGFKKKVLTGIVLQVNQEARLDLVLEVGAVTESVFVTGEAPLLSTESAAVGQVIDNRYNTQIPLNGRDFSQLILLVPGATTRPGGVSLATGATTGSLGSGIAIGGRDAHNNFMMDGANNNARQFGNIAIKPSIDAIQEFKVQSNLYSAEFGHAAFGQINLITKSGTNALHGSVFEFWRNDIFDARNFFLPKVSKLNRNQFGTAVGGPVWKNHTFFFVNYEGTRERRGLEILRHVPVEPWRTGDFSAVRGLTLRDPISGQPFPGNRIPSGRFSRTAQAAIGIWPKQNLGDASLIANNLLVTRPTEISDDQFTVKVDQELSVRDRLSGRYSRAARQEVSTPTLPTMEQIIPPRNHVALLGYTHVFNPQLLSEFRFSFTRSEFVQRSPNTGKVGFYDQFGINNPLAGPQFEGSPTLTFTGITLTSFGEGDFNTQRDISNEFNYAGNLTWTKGDHTIKGGFSITRYQQNTPGPVTGLRRGSFNFRGDFTGHAFADLILGFPFTASRVVGKGVETGRSTWHGYFLNDDWKITRTLTLNLGLRYEYMSPLVDILDRRSVFYPLSNDFNTGLAGQVVIAKTPEARNLLHLDEGVAERAVYAPDRNNWAPRVGLAWTITPRTVLRSGYGIFFTNSQNFLNNFVINRRQPPFAETQQITSSTARPEINIANPFVSAAAPLVIGTQNINPNFREGYTQHWNLTVQRELPGGATVDVGYVANKGTKLSELIFYNVPLPGPSATIQARRPFPRWGTALSMDSYVTSSYNSLQVKGQKRFSKGLSFLTAYTWAKSIDLSSERGNGDRGAGFDSGGGDVRNLRGYSRALSGFDVRHRFVLSYVYELPFGRGRTFLHDLSPAADKILGGWELSGITQFQSGFPFSVLMSGDRNGDGIGQDRPDLVGKPETRTGNPDCYIADSRNAACGTSGSAFADLPAGSLRFGSAGRNILIAPGVNNWDLGVAKNTRFGERFNLQFRAEFFNLFNHANFGQPSRLLDVTAPRFGTINSAGRAREMQFGLKLEF